MSNPQSGRRINKSNPNPDLINEVVTLRKKVSKLERDRALLIITVKGARDALLMDGDIEGVAVMNIALDLVNEP